ncbi:MAG: DSD1 family PLP-dependent enzyme [Acidimicrobiaceae bacterium]|nr:DSD1 family PLP-dependent enzyme [Acidimicrobiaceae bacterium]
MSVASRPIHHFDEIQSLHEIPTPALVCDLGMMLSNIARMSTLAGAAGVSLRPHVKSHKSAFIARRQLDAGAIGLSCAKVSEAEAVIARLDLDGYAKRVSVLITSPVVGAVSAERICELAARCDLSVVVDDPTGVDELAAAADSSGVVLSVLCDVDVGLARTGVVGAPGALRVVERIGEHSSLDFAGVQGYGGHLQHIKGRAARIEATRTATELLGEVIDAIESSGHPVRVRTGGGTGTSGIDFELGVLNELQAGSYIFMDREYRDALGSDLEGRFEHSLKIATTVISANQRDFVTVDAGIKAMATDVDSPLVFGHENSVSYEFFGDEHGLVTNSPDHHFCRGDRLELIPPHCDPTVDRYDFIWLVQGDVVIGVADVVARGCSQ